MAAENFKINVGKTFLVHNHYDKMSTGGVVQSRPMRLNYKNAEGIIFTAGQLLYTEGVIDGAPDFFEITSQIDQTLGLSGYISVTCRSQTYLPIGTEVTRTISIGGSLPFNITISYS